MATIDILGVSHTYELTAPTRSPHVLVFIHGWLLSRRYWLPLIQQLSPEYQCLSYDLRGFGDSTRLARPSGRGMDRLRSRPAFFRFAATPDWSLVSTPAAFPDPLPPRYTPAAYAADLGVLLQRLQIKRAWLIGHSLGGTIALWAADALKDQVQGVICLNSGGGIYLKEEFERFREVGRRILKFRPPWLLHLPLIDWWLCRANVCQPLDRVWGKQRLSDFIQADPEAATGALLDSTTPEEVHQLPQIVARLQQPVYFIAGREDGVMELKYVQHLASFHPLFKSEPGNVIEIAQCGHLSMIEQTQAIAVHLHRILSQSSSA